VRTACGIAQGLAFGTDLPVLMVDTLMAMALACRNDGAAAEVQPALDARMGELYWARYRWVAADAADAADTDADGLPEVVVAPRLALPANVDLDPQIKRCGNGYSAHGNHFATVLGSTNFYAAIMPHALQVARLGAALLARGAEVAARDAQPFYLRNNVALTTAERLARVDLNRTPAPAAQGDVGKPEDTVTLTAPDAAPAAATR
jgi:tRNA threonylcarbamoyladenosine biosynthesis protein TsaB